MSLVQRKAPNFQGVAVVGNEFKTIKLDDYKGKWVVLFFYPLDFTFVCPTEITAFDDRLADFKKLGAELIACSVDSQFSHLKWNQLSRKDGGLGGIKYPILSDLNKQIAADYGVLNDGGVALRGLYVINPEGNVCYEVVHDLPVGRSVEETLRVIQAFQNVAASGEVCPANWTKGGKTMKADPVKSKDYFGSLE